MKRHESGQRSVFRLEHNNKGVFVTMLKSIIVKVYQGLHGLM
jgi:hypothetical protein